MKLKNEIAVGVLFAVAIVILAYFTIMVKHEVFESGDYYWISVRFPHVEGLEVGDDVKVNGVKVGVVNRIVLEDEYIVTYLKMFSAFSMYENYRIKVASESALGGKFISIYPGVRRIEGVSFKEVETRTNLKGISGDDPFALLSELIVDNRESIYLTLKNIQQITSKINAGQGTLGKLINESQVHDNAANVLSSFKDTVEDAREQAPITSFIRAALTAF